MELFAGAPLALSLIVLALLDGLSVGTLLIPVFLLLSPGRVRGGRIILYLATIAGFYLVIGLLFLWGLVNVVDVANEFLGSPAGLICRLVVGVGLIIAAFAVPTSKPKERVDAAPAAQHGLVEASALSADASRSGSPATDSGAPPRPGRIVRWRERMLDPKTSRGMVMGVALAAGAVEVATMLPYIVAMTMLADAGVDVSLRVLALAGYCLLMILPALVLLALRIVAAPLVARPLQRFAAWMERTGAENTAWIIGIIGFLVARTAASELGIFDALAKVGG
ncbi:GAP family protein [Microbacterium aurantiacum]|uniref:GAP family protein n=1 Tax=Microbacterium aurantiacum TaxID=162393 RepID=UPI000C802C3A|nr:GAP family protein [Microbacterium aurantiacum]